MNRPVLKMAQLTGQ